MKLKLTVDEERYCDRDLETSYIGVVVSAKLNGIRGVYDVAHLDKPSLLAWLRSRGGDNQLAEDCVGILLGHGPLHDSQVDGNMSTKSRVEAQETK